MRISCRQTDPDFIPDYASTDVFLDGKRVSHVIWADDTAGQVGHYTRDPETGSFKLAPHGKDLAIDVSSGRVEIVRKKRK